MKRSSLTPKKLNQEKLSTLDSVSANELLKALHTLESINIIQEQIDEDLNISFSQKDTFSHDEQTHNQHFNKSITTHNLPSTTKNKTLKSSIKQSNHPSALKSKKPKESTEIDQNIGKNSKGGKMNFQFYMNKKQHTTMGLLKNRLKSPRPSYQPKGFNNKSLSNIISSTGKQLKQNMTPRGQTNRYSHNRTITVAEYDRRNTSVSPLTERSTNVVRRDDFRLKTQADEKQSSRFQKRHTKTNSNLIHSNREDQFGKTNMSNLTTCRQITNLIQTQPSNPPSITNKKIPTFNPLHNMPMHERNKQYLRQKNERLAKLCQQMEEKKREQEKECTFKPKIINDNTNIKPKYNDLCVSRELINRGPRKCKQGKENTNEQEIVGFQCKDGASKSGKCESQFVKSNKQDQNKKQILYEESISRVNEDQIIFQQRATVSLVKSKYKNSKFNILLDLIH